MSDDFGLDKVLSQLESLKNIDSSKVSEAGLYKLVALASPIVPVKTGALKANWTVEPDDKGAKLTYSQEYAFYQEFGSAKMPAANHGTGFIRPSIDTGSDEILNTMASEIHRQERELLK